MRARGADRAAYLDMGSHVMKYRLATAASTAILALVGTGANPAADRSIARIDERITALQPTADERRIDRIGWARDIRTALRLAREHGRPVFLFTMDGRFSVGRC